MKVVSQKGVAYEAQGKDGGELSEKAKEVFFLRGAKVGEFVLKVADEVVVGRGGKFEEMSGKSRHEGIIAKRGSVPKIFMDLYRELKNGEECGNIKNRVGQWRSWERT